MGRPPRGTESFKIQIVRIRTNEPDVTYREIAERVGCSRATVRYVCSLEGVTRAEPPKRWKEKYFEIRDKHPDWRIPRIAKELGVGPSTLYGIQKRSDLSYQSVAELGRAAVRAGLTVQQIEAMANARHV